MDERMATEELVQSFLIEEPIPDNDAVYRQCIGYKKEEGMKIPKPSNFDLSLGEDGLSVNWCKYIDVKNAFCILGISHNRNSEYLDHKSFKIFKFPVKFLRDLREVKAVIHNPLSNGLPPKIGKPNNKSHSLIEVLPDEEIRTALTIYCRRNYAESYCDFDVKALDKEVQELRDRIDTPYHNHKWQIS